MLEDLALPLFPLQYTGPKPTDDQQPVELPEGKKVLIFCFNVLLKNSGGSARSIDDAVEDMRPLMLLVFYFVDKVRKCGMEDVNIKERALRTN